MVGWNFGVRAQGAWFGGIHGPTPEHTNVPLMVQSGSTGLDPKRHLSPTTTAKNLYYNDLSNSVERVTATEKASNFQQY